MAKLDKVSMSHVADSIQKQTIFYYPVSDRNSGSLAALELLAICPFQCIDQ